MDTELELKNYNNTIQYFKKTVVYIVISLSLLCIALIYSQFIPNELSNNTFMIILSIFLIISIIENIFCIIYTHICIFIVDSYPVGQFIILLIGVYLFLIAKGIYDISCIDAQYNIQNLLIIYSGICTSNIITCILIIRNM